MRTTVRTVLGFIIAFAGAAAWGQPDSAAVDRLTALVVKTFPIGDAFQPFIDRTPSWPLMEKAARVSPQQLECLRHRLSSQGYAQSRRETVESFAKRYPDRVEGSIRVLEAGGADVFGSAIDAGVKSTTTGAKIEFKDIANNFSPLQMSAFVELIADEKHQALRELIGIDNALSLNANSEENAARGRNKGQVIGAKLMFTAMDVCKIPLAAIQ